MTTAEQPFANKRLFLFDWSGTISDDRHLVFKANMQLLQAHNEPRISWRDWLNSVDQNASDYLAKKQGLDVRQLYQEYAEIFDQVLASGAPARLYPDTCNTLGYLTEQAKTVYVISSHPYVEREIAQNGLSMYISKAIGSVSDKVPVINTERKAAGVEPNEAVYIGDTIQDIRAAQQCGVMAVAVAHGYHSYNKLAAQAPDCLVNNLRALITKVG